MEFILRQGNISPPERIELIQTITEYVTTYITQDETIEKRLHSTNQNDPKLQTIRQWFNLTDK
jgi:hypothetical protein